MRKMGIWREYLIEKLVDRERAIGYLKAILDDYQIDRSRTVVLRALQTVVEAQGGVSELAKQVDMDAQFLSKILSNEDTPLIDALGIVLKALGYQLSIKPLESVDSHLETDTKGLDGQDVSTHVTESPTSLQ